MAVRHGDLTADITRARQPRIDMDVEWRRAIRQARSALAGYGQELLPDLRTECPIALVEPLGDDLGVSALIACIGQG